MIRRLESRLRRHGPDLASEPAPPAPEDLDRELEEYFRHVSHFDRVGAAARKPGAVALESGGETAQSLGAATGLEAIRGQVVEEVVDRILREWESPGDPHARTVEREIIDRLVERLLERLSS